MNKLLYILYFLVFGKMIKRKLKNYKKSYKKIKKIRRKKKKIIMIKNRLQNTLQIYQINLFKNTLFFQIKIL